MRESMLLGFVEELGHEYDHLLEGGAEDDGAGIELDTLSAANDHIKDTIRNPDEDEDQSEDDEDEE